MLKIKLITLLLLLAFVTGFSNTNDSINIEKDKKELAVIKINKSLLDRLGVSDIDLDIFNENFETINTDSVISIVIDSNFGYVLEDLLYVEAEPNIEDWMLYELNTQEDESQIEDCMLEELNTEYEPQIEDWMFEALNTDGNTQLEDWMFESLK